MLETYSGDLKSDLVWILIGPKEVGFWMGSEIWKPNPLKSGQMAAIMSKTFWNLDKNVRILNGLVF